MLLDSAEGSFDPAKTSMFGYELNEPLRVRKSWFRALPSSEEYLSIENPNVILLNLKSTKEGIVLRLLNSDSENNETAKIKSKLFTNFNAEAIDLLGNKTQNVEVIENIITLSLKPGEFSDILIKSLNK